MSSMRYGERRSSATTYVKFGVFVDVNARIGSYYIFYWDDAILLG